MISQASVTVEGESRVIAAGAGVMRIGRDKTCDLVLSDPSVSAAHALLSFEPDGWVYEDQSTYGSYLDGARIHRIALGTNGADIRLADASSGPLLSIRILGTEPPVTSRSGGPGSRVGARPSAALMRIGRSADNDIVISEDLSVSRHHAELRTGPRGTEIADLGSSAGVFVNGRRVALSAVSQGDVIGIGRHLFVLDGIDLVEYVDDQATLTVHGLSVELDGGRRLLSDVSFVAAPGNLVAVVGPSGAGKSTLLRTLIGTLRPTTGAVLYNDRPIHQAFEELRSRIGYVPQDDVLHVELTPRQALGFAAELRFSSETTTQERIARVHAVLAELGLSERIDVPITQLSGGQRKRASVALELLAEPALLLLDEPTSGLDPGLERSVMELLRDLASAGRTVVVITHATTSLALCDQVLVLAPGGRVAFFGHPDDVLHAFNVQDYPAVFQRLQEDPEGIVARWRDRVAFPVASPPSPPPSGSATTATHRRRADERRQFSVLVRRHFALLRANRNATVLLLAQAPALAALILLALPPSDFAAASEQNPRSLLLVLSLAAIAMGLVNSSREIVREVAIYDREHLIGLSPNAYVAAKLAVLGMIAAAQALILTVVVLGVQKGPASHLVLPSMVELYVVAVMSMLAAICLGLALSATVRSDAAALTLVPVILIAQLVLSGAIIDIERSPVLRALAYLSPSHWAFAGAAASADLRALDPTCLPGTSTAPCSNLWNHDVGTLGLAVIVLVVLAIILVAICRWSLVRRDSR